MSSRPSLRPTFLLVVSFLALILVIGLVWAMVFEEQRSRSLSLQFEIYRASAALVEGWLDNPKGNFVGGPVLGFGVYGADGRAITAQGSAPEWIDPAARRNSEPVLGKDGSSLYLLRPLPARNGMDRYGMRGPGMMRGAPPGAGMMGGPAFGSDSSPLGPLDLVVAGTRSMWLEYSVTAGSLGETLLVTGGAVLSLILVGIYALVLILLKRNGELRERETKNRELAELGQAARTLVHEIKNPLGVIGIQAATLRRREGEDSATGRAALVIDGEVRRLAGMADRIREFLKAGPGEARETELGAFLEAFVLRHDPEGASGGAGGISLHLHPEGGTALVRVDPERLALALDNLFANACEADVGALPSIELARKARFWIVTVADRGRGVEVESRERLFEPFFTTKEKGSGIGLALARSIARQAGGDLVYAPRPGGGSLFSLSLPASD